MMRLLEVALGVVAVAAITIGATTSSLDGWIPEIAISAISLLLTIEVVDRILARQKQEDERARVRQALRRISGAFHVLADFVLWDYSDLHRATYVRPPNELRAFLAHWREGLDSRDAPWPERPRFLDATETLARHLEEQIGRHERVLDHSFIAMSYDFIRHERIGRNMYLHQRVPHREDDRKRVALVTLTDAAVTLLDAYEPLALRYLRPDWSVVLTDDDLESVEWLRDDSDVSAR